MEMLRFITYNAYIRETAREPAFETINAGKKLSRERARPMGITFLQICPNVNATVLRVKQLHFTAGIAAIPSV